MRQFAQASFAPVDRVGILNDQLHHAIHGVKVAVKHHVGKVGLRNEHTTCSPIRLLFKRSCYRPPSGDIVWHGCLSFEIVP